MKKLNYIKSTVVPILLDNIDTDQIIPARFLKATDRKGFGKNLFRDWRYDRSNKEVESFALNKKKWSGEILLAGSNFGCGSSREHAAWAIKDYGFKVVISTSFADIFKGNALNNGLLPIEISEEFYDILKEELVIDTQTMIEVSLERQEVILVISGMRERFEIPAYKKECLLQGLDDLDYLIEMRDGIEESLLTEIL
jgi:3-isopropylmalate/(R)-2-methylmalate dehydratase small subunit